MQAIARDCLAYAIERLEETGYHLVFHVHDEVVISMPRDLADAERDPKDPDKLRKDGNVARIMSQPIPWALDLPLAADGWVGEFYRKD